MHVCRVPHTAASTPPCAARIRWRTAAGHARTYVCSSWDLLHACAPPVVLGPADAPRNSPSSSMAAQGGAGTNSERELRGRASMQAVSVRTPETQGPSTTSSESLTKNPCVPPNCVRAYASFPLPPAYTATSHVLIVDAPTRRRGVYLYGAGSCVCGGRSRMGPMCFFTRRQHQSSASPRRGMEARTTFRRARTSPRMAASASSL